ncbi:methyltransferase domain-containing protein [Mycolicibacterium sp. Dal123E01]|uniref:methyltransferase domain-containing protein n=1 Tax=Mycolicibacterium sp. Dal123E01 TaxID=3457578 RepID=UPI00403E7EAC
MITLDALIDQGLFACPRCGSSVRHESASWRCSNAACHYAKNPFPVVSGKPALVDFEKSVLDVGRLRATEGASVMRRKRRLPRPLLRLLEGRNRVAPLAVARMLELLHRDAAEANRRPRILVVGGGTIGSGVETLYSDPDVDLIAFDVYESPVVQFIGDGHAIPLADGSVDGVVVQAVLAYVLEPWVVAQEIHRVLRDDGVVFAATPFMQQVCEGAYDFTRFTDTGLRWLFRGFERIESGAVAGAGTALLWSLGYFARALTRSLPVSRIVQLAFFWLRHMDRFLDPRYAIDAASGVFFLGRKTARPIAQGDIAKYYQGGFPAG